MRPSPWQFGQAPCGVLGENDSAYSSGWPRRIVAGARVQHAQQVRQRRHAADRRAGGRRAALLLQGDGRRQAIDLVHLRHGHLVKQPPGVRRYRFQVAALRFGVERAEGQRRFAGSRYAREDDQRIARDIDIDVLQIVLARAAHVHHTGRIFISHEGRMIRKRPFAVWRLRVLWCTTNRSHKKLTGGIGSCVVGEMGVTGS